MSAIWREPLSRGLARGIGQVAEESGFNGAEAMVAANDNVMMTPARSLPYAA